MFVFVKANLASVDCVVELGYGEAGKMWLS